MDNKVKAIVFQPTKGKAVKVLLGRDDKDSLLKSIYSVMDVDMVEHVVICDGLEAYVDEEGLLKDKPTFGLVYTDVEGNITRALAGNILFINSDANGNTISLTEKQIEKIASLELYPLRYVDGRSNYAMVIKEEPRLVC